MPLACMTPTSFTNLHANLSQQVLYTEQSRRNPHRSSRRRQRILPLLPPSVDQPHRFESITQTYFLINATHIHILTLQTLDLSYIAFGLKTGIYVYHKSFHMM